MHDELRHRVRTRRLELGLKIATCGRQLGRELAEITGGTSDDDAREVTRRLAATWRSWEDGRVRIPAEAMRPIARILSTSVCRLYYENPEPSEVVRLVEEVLTRDGSTRISAT